MDQLKETNPEELDDVLNNLVERDRIDSSRAVSPLRQFDDAVVSTTAI